MSVQQRGASTQSSSSQRAGSCLVKAVYPSAYLFFNFDGGPHLGVLPHQPEASADDDVQAGCWLVLPAPPAYLFAGLL